MHDNHKTKAQLITELKEMRRRVSQIEEADESQRDHSLLPLIAETAASAIFIYQDSVFLYTNPATSELTGYTTDELRGANIWNLVHPEHRDSIRERVEAWRRGEPVPNRSEFKIITRSGETRWIDADSTFIEFEGRPAALTIAHDTTGHKTAEEALRKTQERLQHVLSFSPAIIYLLQIKDGGFTTEWVSESLTRLTGHEQRDALAEGWWVDHIHPEDRARVQAELPRLFAGDRLDLEYRFQHKDGGYLWLHNESRLLRDQSGKPIEVVGSWLDVTERREAEVALRDSEERFRTLVSSMDDMVFTVDLDRRHTGAFGSWIERFGLERRDLIGRTASEIFGADAALIHEQAYARALAGEQVIYEWSMAADGQRTHFQTSLSSIRDQSGKVTGMVGVGRDITARKQAGEALRESQSRMTAILDNCPSMIFLKDLDGRYLEINRQFERTFNLSDAEALGRTDAEIFPTELAEVFQATDRAALEAGRPLEFEESAVYDDGPHTYIVHKFPLHGASAVPYAVGGISTDITGRKKAEDDLRKQKEVLQKIFDHIPVMISFIGEDHRPRLVNREWERVLGWSLEDIESKNLDVLAELYPDPGQYHAVLNFIAESNAEWADFRTRIRGGEVIDTSWANVYLSDGTSIGIGRDITERKRAEKLLRRQTAQLAALHEIELEIGAESELNRVLDVITRRAAELLNAYHCSICISSNENSELNLVSSLDRGMIGLSLKEGEGLAGRIAQSGEAEAIDDYCEWSGRVTTFDATNFGPALGAPLKWQHIVIGTISLCRKRGEERFTIADKHFLEQIAAQAAIAIHQTTLFEEVQEGQRRLQVLSHRLIDAQEAERKRLARELHDQIGQALTAVQISLQTLQSSTHDSSTKLLEDSLAIIDEALQQVHDLSLDLRPSLLDDLGLVAALRWYLSRVASRAGLVHGFKADVPDTRLAPEVETACFRIAQEALTNVLRHASATNVSVEITYGNSNLRLLVRDNGVGFDVGTAMSRTGLRASLGLQGMQERAAAVGGSIDVESKLRRGTQIKATFLMNGRLPNYEQ